MFFLKCYRALLSRAKDEDRKYFYPKKFWPKKEESLVSANCIARIWILEHFSHRCTPRRKGFSIFPSKKAALHHRRRVYTYARNALFSREVNCLCSGYYRHDVERCFCSARLIARTSQMSQRSTASRREVNGSAVGTNSWAT
jgi:hypothetical protein